jgi:acetyl-CoA carboxylase carboxyltransferase component
MPVLKSRLNPRSAEFRENAERMRGLVTDLREKVAQAARGGPEEARARHAGARQAAAARSRDTLLDPGSPFLEFGHWPRTACTAARCRPRDHHRHRPRQRAASA